MSYPYFSPFAVELCQSVSQYHNGAAPQHQDRDQGRGEQKMWRRGDIIPMSLFQFKMQRIESLNSCNRSFDPGIWGRADRDPWFIYRDLAQSEYLRLHLPRSLWSRSAAAGGLSRANILTLEHCVAQRVWYSGSHGRLVLCIFFFLFLDLLRKNFLANWMNEMLSHTFASCLLTVCTNRV